MMRPVLRPDRSGRATVAVALLALLVAAAGTAALLLGLRDTAPSTAAGSAAAAAAVAGDQRVILDSGRSYELHVPAALRDPAARRGLPVLVMLHGLASDPADAAQSTGFDALADADHRLVAYPYGIRRSFNAGLCCGAAVPEQVDDVGFLSQVVQDLKARGASRVAVVGFSNGAMMALRLACERPGLVDVVGAMSGTLEVPRCDGPIRALEFHGAKDTTVPLAGQAYNPRLKCFLRDPRQIASVAPGSTIDLQVLPGYGHRWTRPGDPVNATRAFWDFARMASP